MRPMARESLLLAALVFLNAAAPPRLVIDLSQPRVDIQHSFAGTDVQLYGAIETPGRGPPERIDAVVIMRGPAAPLVIRQKQKIAGIWLNTRSVRFETAPAYYGVASTRPISQIVSPQTAAIYQLGIDFLHLSPAETERSPDELRAFERGFVDLQKRRTLYFELPGAVRIVEGVLFNARLHLPATVPPGDYRGEVFLVARRQVIAHKSVMLEVNRIGFERWVYRVAHEQSLAYGVAAVVIALAMGWAAAVVFRRN